MKGRKGKMRKGGKLKLEIIVNRMKQLLMTKDADTL